MGQRSNFIFCKCEANCPNTIMYLFSTDLKKYLYHTLNFNVHSNLFMGFSLHFTDLFANSWARTTLPHYHGIFYLCYHKTFCCSSFPMLFCLFSPDYYSNFEIIFLKILLHTSVFKAPLLCLQIDYPSRFLGSLSPKARKPNQNHDLEGLV